MKVRMDGICTILLSLCFYSVTALAQTAGSSTGGSGAGTTDPLGTTLNDSITFTTKANNAGKSEVNVGATYSWLFGCIEPSSQHPTPGDKSQKGNPCGGWLGSQNTEIQTQGAANYDDTWKSAPAPSIVVQQYNGAVNILHAGGRPDDPITARFPWEKPFLHWLHAAGVLASFSEAHDDSQGILSNTKVGGGFYYQRGTLQGQSEPGKTYIVFSLQGQGIKTDKYGTGWKPWTFAGYETFRLRKKQGAFEFDFSQGLSLPSTNTGSTIQGVIDGKVSYCINNRLSLTVEEVEDYYGPGLIAGPISSESASLATIGLTFKFQPPSVPPPIIKGTTKNAAPNSAGVSCSQ